MNALQWSVVLVALATICALLGVAVDSVLNPPTPADRERNRQAVADWYGHEDARRETPRRRTGDGKQTPAPSFAGPTAARTEVTRGREQRIDGQVAPCPWAQRDPGSS